MHTIIRVPVLAALAFAFSLVLLLLPRTSLAAEVTITMNGSSFSPSTITINPGDTVRWINSSGMSHTATADNGSFDSGAVASGQSVAVTLNNPGAVRYYCKFHGGPGGSGMSGSITVVAPADGGQQQYINNTNVNGNVNANANPSTAQMQAQAAALLVQIAALKQQLGIDTGVATSGTGTGTGAVGDSSSCPQLGRSLYRGMSGPEVLRLQKFLATDPAIYPEAIVSGYFGANTERAVQRWQAKYHVVSSGAGYGVAGPRTAAAIAILCTTGSYNGVAGPGAKPTVGGYITVSPIAGAAPLAVNVTATVNTVNACGGAIYTLDFGDSTAPQQIPVSAGNCGQLNQAYPHTYQYGGTYKILLSAGSHSTSATVTVTGNAAPPPPQFTADLPRESFTVAPTSGTSPLTVTFAGIVNSNDAGFCVGGCASTLDFGDGSLASVNLPASVGGWLNYSVSHTYTQSGGFRATLYQGGAGPQQPTIGSVTIIVGAPGPGTTSGYSYSPPSPTSAGAGTLAFTVSFDLPSSCTGYRLSWGDGTSEEIQNDGGTGCAQTPALKTLQHTYSVAGAFTITVKRGADLSRVDDVLLTIAN